MSFELYPAIDLRAGRCVRLLQGDYDREVRYDADPLETARRFAAAGARWLHLVDLDAARSGTPEPLNRAVITAIAAAKTTQAAPATTRMAQVTPARSTQTARTAHADEPSSAVQVQVGGGIRSVQAAVSLYDVGIDRCVIGTAAVERPEIVEQIAGLGHRVAVGLDVRGAEVATRGWERRSGVNVTQALRRLADAGAEAVIVTQIARDGMGQGADLAGLRVLLNADELPSHTDLIASGGVGTASDIADLTQLRGRTGRRLSGVIVGKSLHDGRLGIAEALVSARRSTFV